MEAGSVVWAKLGTYPHWPAKVVEFSEVPKKIREQLDSSEADAGKNCLLVWFFGSHNYSFVSRDNVELWDATYEERSTNKKTKNQRGFIKAIEEAKKSKEEGSSSSTKKTTTTKETKSQNKSKKSEEQEDDKEDEESEDTNKNTNEEEADEVTSSKRPPKKDTKSQPKSKVEEQKEDQEEAEDDNKTAQEESAKEQDKEHTKQKELPKKKKESDNQTESNDKSKTKPTVDKGDEASKKRTATPENSEKKENKKPRLKSDSEQQEPEKKLDTPSKKLTPAAISLSLKTLARHPVAKYFKYELTKSAEGTATAKAFIPSIRENKEEVHNCLGAMHFLVDITAFAACAALFQEGDSGLTQDIHVACLAPNIPLGIEVTLKANVLPSKSPHLVFIAVEVFANNKQIIYATVTKTTAEYNFPIVHSREQQ